MDSSFLYAVDLCGTFVFALSGGFRAVQHQLDGLGVLVLAILTGVGGGILRDLLLGATPPAVFQDEWFLAVCVLGGLMVFFSASRVAEHWRWVLVADAIGLGVFAALGASKGVAYGLGPIGVLMMAGLTATGGGVIRDVLVRDVPAVIKRDFYATAALLGGGAYLGAHLAGVPAPVPLLLAAFTASGLRFYAMHANLNLPRARLDDWEPD